MLEKVKDCEELMAKVEKGCLEKYTEMVEDDQDKCNFEVLIIIC